MARVRSIHPGIWTDDAFMSLSAHARLLFFGLWNEAFDDGVFEWKPLTLKARIFPVDPVDVEELLAELVSVGMIARIDSQEKRPGAIRNFQKFQRPKKPNSSGMLPDEWRDFVGVSTTSSEPVRNQSPTGSEKSPQMEEGGGNRRGKESSEPDGSGAGAPTEDLEVRLFRRGKEVLGKNAGGVISKLKSHCRGNLDEALANIETAAGKQSPMEWVQGILRKPDPDEEIYRNVDSAPPTPEEAARWKAAGLS